MLETLSIDDSTTQPASASGNSESQPVNPFLLTDRVELDPRSEQFSLESWARNWVGFQNKDPKRYPRLGAGVAFRNLSVSGSGPWVDHQSTVANYLLGLFSRALQQYVRHGRPKSILRDFDGLIKEGEVLLALGRPGSGCTTLLKTIAGNTHGLMVHSESDMNFQGVDRQTMHTYLRSECTYQADMDVHFPQLTVRQTLDFAASARVPHNRPPTVSRPLQGGHLCDIALRLFGLSHVAHTRVGSDMVAGVSGGERKRVSLAEAVLCGSVVQSWDNSTRGLDSAAALRFFQTLRTYANMCLSSTVATAYQVSEEVFQLFDKVTVLYDGWQVFFGPIEEAGPYFESLGFERPTRQPTADFLTAVTNPGERKVRPGFEHLVPRTAAEFARAWHDSKQRVQLLSQIHRFNEQFPIDHKRTQQWIDKRKKEKSSHNRQKSPYTLSFRKQIGLCLHRAFLILLSDLSAVISTAVANTILSVVFASVFYNLPDDTSSFFRRGSLIFYALLLGAMTSSLEIMTLYEKRPIVEKQAEFALYHPSADAIASMISDLPNKLITSILFNVPLYFMTNLRRTGEAFFTFMLLSFSCTMAMSMIFRLIGASSRSLSQALAPAAVFILAVVIYAGFALPIPYMPPWLRWFNYINPIGYGFEGLLINEFRDRIFPCASYLPTGLGYENVSETHQVCAVNGAVAGMLTVSGDDYLWQTYRFEPSHLWRNVAIIWAITVAGFAANMWATERIRGKRSAGDIALYLHNGTASKRARITNPASDEEIVLSDGLGNAAMSGLQTEISNRSTASLRLTAPDLAFQWHSLCYEIPLKGGPRQILNGIDGWIEPGTITALMGPSGAGKTTLLDVLSNRTSIGKSQGDILVNGRKRDVSFQRKTGYAKQQDVHVATTTVREGLAFSALLRQPQAIPREEKLSYVEEVIRLLELEDVADAIVGTPGNGLNVEQRKRFTIGVELVAKPELLFLDEPTSGLDSQTAWSILHLMRKLARNGQTILCTIHQPSAILFEMFDRLLLLTPDGRSAYFGQVGENAQAVISYFEANGAPACEPTRNPAEWMLGLVSQGAGGHIEWDKTWDRSVEKQQVEQYLEHMREQLSQRPRVENDSGMQSEYAASSRDQLIEVSKRVLRQYWRTPSYLYSKAILCVASALFIGISFWKSPPSIQGLQNQLLSTFLLLSLFSNLAEQMGPNFVAQRAVYEARELRSKVYSWKVFIFANIFVEILWNSAMTLPIFFCWYYPIGMNANAVSDTAERGILVFFFLWQFLLFCTTLTLGCVVGVELSETGNDLANLLFSISMIFCGVLSPPTDLPGFWKWVNTMSPCTYLVDGLVSTGLAGSRIQCAESELLSITPLSNQTCAQYMNTYINRIGGYLINPDASSNCQFCQLSNTNQYLKTVGFSYAHRFRNLSLLWWYILFNVAFAVFVYRYSRVPRVRQSV